MISVGQKIPSAILHTMTADGPKAIDSLELLGHGKVVLFNVPGAFTPTCSNAHLPGFVVMADQIKAKGVNAIACMAVNDAFVMDAWGKSQNAEELLMVADGNAAFAKAMGLESDASGFGMGVRSRRFAMILQDGIVQHLAVEQPREFKVSSAEAILAAL